MSCKSAHICAFCVLYWFFTNDKDDFGSRSGWIEHFVLLYELRRLRQVRVALDGELADGREAVIPSVGEIGTVGQHCHTDKDTNKDTHTWIIDKELFSQSLKINTSKIQ